MPVFRVDESFDKQLFKLCRREICEGARIAIQFTVFFEPQEGGFNVIVPAIPEICTFGETLEEAREMAAKDAIRRYIESALKHGEPIPTDVEPTKEQLVVTVSPPPP